MTVTIATEILPLEDELPLAAYRWDSKTEILAATLDSQPTGERDFRTVQLGGSQGAYVSLILVEDLLVGIEVVVWPHGEVVSELAAPPAERSGRLKVDSRGEVTRSAVVDLDKPLSCARTADESRVHIVFAKPESSEVVALAQNLFAEIGDAGRLAGFWLVGVPPFPEMKEA